MNKDAQHLPKPRQRLKQFLWAIAILLLMIGGLVWTIGPYYSKQVIRAKLIAIIQGHLNVDVEIGELTYHAPMGVEIHGMRLLTHAHSTTQPGIMLASFETLNLSLGRNPLLSGPLDIERIDITNPTLHLVRTHDGIIGQKNILRTPEEIATDAVAPPKLSEVLDLRHVQLNDMRIEYEDRTDARTPPLVWDHMDIDLQSTPKGNAGTHEFSFVGHTGDLADVTSHGTFDIDTFVCDLTDLTVHAQLDPNSNRTPLPPELMGLIQSMQICGKSSFVASGNIPFRQIESSNLLASLSVIKGRGQIPGWQAPIEDLTLGMEFTSNNGKLSARLAQFSGHSGGSAISVAPLRFDLDLATHQWRTDPLRIDAAYTPLPGEIGFYKNPVHLTLVAQAVQNDDGRFAVNVDGSRASLGTDNLVLDLTGKLQIDRTQIVFPALVLGGAGGSISSAGRFSLADRRLSMDITIAGVEIEPIAKLFNTTHATKGKLSGNAVLAIDKTISSMVGAGTITVRDGLFGASGYNVPQAMTQFSIHDQKIQFNKSTITTTLAHLRGEGTVGFDQSLHLTFYAAAGGNWRKTVERADIPLIGGLTATIAGGAQSVLSGASSQFTQFNVTGDIGSPKITPTPVPVITNAIRGLFE